MRLLSTSIDEMLNITKQWYIAFITIVTTYYFVRYPYWLWIVGSILLLLALRRIPYIRVLALWLSQMINMFNWICGDKKKLGYHLTFKRLCESNHMEDLQWIASFALVALFGLLWHILQYAFSRHEASYIISVAYSVAAADDNSSQDAEKVKFATAMLSASAAIMAWAYLAGSKRIGAIDLFASEISLICRACIVTDFAEKSISMATHGRKSTVSTESDQYTPFYDLQISELKPLDVDVVTAINEFYFFRKVMRSYLNRAFVEEDAKDRVKLFNDMIYMQFLMYESGRRAISHLAENGPAKLTSIMAALSSELILYKYLRHIYTGWDFRAERLELREIEYITVLNQIKSEIKYANTENEEWKKALIMWKRLKKALSKGGTADVNLVKDIGAWPIILLTLSGLSELILAGVLSQRLLSRD